MAFRPVEEHAKVVPVHVEGLTDGVLVPFLEKQQPQQLTIFRGRPARASRTFARSSDASSVDSAPGTRSSGPS